MNQQLRWGGELSWIGAEEGINTHAKNLLPIKIIIMGKGEGVGCEPPRERNQQTKKKLLDKLIGGWKGSGAFKVGESKDPSGVTHVPHAISNEDGSKGADTESLGLSMIKMW